MHVTPITHTTKLKSDLRKEGHLKAVPAMILGCTKIRFSLNQVGLMIEYYHALDNEWRGLDLIKLKQSSQAQDFIGEWLKDRRALGYKLEVESINL